MWKIINWQVNLLSNFKTSGNTEMGLKQYYQGKKLSRQIVTLFSQDMATILKF